MLRISRLVSVACQETFTEVRVQGQRVLIRVHVTPNAREVRVVRVTEVGFEVKVDAKATGGQANKRLLGIMSQQLKVPKSRILIVSGAKSRDKVLQIL